MYGNLVFFPAVFAQSEGSGLAQGKNFLFDKRQEQIPENKPEEETEKEVTTATGQLASQHGFVWFLNHLLKHL